MRYEGDVVPASFLTTLDGRPGLIAEFSTGEMWGPQRTVLAERPVNDLDLKAEELPPNTSFTVFLTELAEFPFGASEYVAEFTTNAAGRGSVRADAVIQEAFAFDGNTRVRKELNHVVVWFADPSDDDVCFGPGGGPITPFDGDSQAGTTVLSSKNFLSNAPLP